MPSELKFNIGMNKTEFMTGSKEVARAIASLKTTVMQAGKSMNSSAVGYGTAMRQYSKVSREASESIRGIKTQLDTLRKSVSDIKAAADAFRTLQERIEASEKDITKMQGQMSALESNGGKYSQAWQDNQKNIAASRAELEKTTNAYHDYDEAVKYAQKRLATGKDEWGHGLTNEERNTYAEEAKYNQEYADKASAQMAKMQANVQALEREEAALIAQGQNLPSEAWQRLQTEIDSERQSVTNMKEELGVMKEKGFENADQTSDYNSQVNAIKSLEAALDAAQSKKNELIKPPYMQAWDNMTRLSGLVAEGFGRIQNVAQGALYAVTHPIQAIDRALGTVIAKVGQTISSFARMAGSSAVNFLKRLASEAKNAAIQLAKMAANAVTSGFKKVASGAATAAKGVLKFNRAHKGTGDTLKMGLRNILRYAFGIRSMFFLFRRLRAAISEGFGELKKQNPEVKASLDSLSASFNGLKASLASAFAPILTAVAPALTTLINMLTAAMNVVAAFMAALGGGKTYSKAVGGMKATGKAAGGAGKKVKELKRELASFDELTIINDQNKSGGGGGGGGGGSALKYQTEQIPSAVQDFVDSLKKAWEEGDYTKVGEIVAGKINGVFESALKLITWENVEDKVEAGVSAVAGVFNGLTDPRKGINFKKIGITFSEGVRTLINSIDRLVNKISTANIGIAIANFLNGVVANTALFDAAKQGLEDITEAVTNLASAFLNNFDEASLAQRIRETLGDSSMWENIGYDIWNVIKLAFNKTGNFLNVLFGGDNSNKDPNVSRMMRQRPQNIVPKYEIDSKVFDDLAENFANRFNEFVTKTKEFITSLPAAQVASAITKWLFKVNNGVSWTGVGSVIGASLRKVFDVAKVISKEIRQNASTLGKNLADAINAIIKEAFPEGGGGIGKMFSDSVISAFDFVTAFMKQFDEQNLIDKLKTDVDWDGIANAAWEAFKTAVEKLGNFLTLLFGGEVEVKPDVVKPAQKQKGLVTDAGTGNKPDSDIGVGNLFSDLVTTIIGAVDKALHTIPWSEWGDKIHDFILDIKWGDIAQKLWDAIVEAARGMGDLIMSALFGKDVAEQVKAQRQEEESRDRVRLARQNEQKQMEPKARAEAQMSDVQKKVLQDNIQSMIDEGQFYFDIDDFEGFSPDAVQSAVDEFIRLWNEKYSNEPITFDDDVSGLVSFVDEWNKANPNDQFELIGESSVDGIVSGVENKTGEIEDAGKSIGAGLAGGAKAELAIESPSKVFESIGEMAVAGLINGLNTLPAALKGVWDNLPEWAQTLLGNSASNFKLAISGGGNGGNSGGGSSAQTKETKKNTKELKKNTKKRAEVDVNYEGAGFDTSGEKPTLNVGVNFAPNGEEASEENTNGGLLGWLQNLFSSENLVVGVVALLTGKDPSSVTIGDIFDTILKVVGFLTGKDPKSLNIGDIFGAILKIVGFLTGKDPKSLSLADIFDTILQVIAGKPIFGAGVVASSLINLFTGGKSVSATGVFRGAGVLISGLIDLFTGGKEISATGAYRSKGVLQSSLIDLFTWGRRVFSTGAYLDGIKKLGVLDLFTWGRRVFSTGAYLDGVKEGAVIKLFKWAKNVVANGAKRGDGVKKDAVTSLFDTTVTVTAKLSSTIKGLGGFVSKIVEKVNKGLKGVTGGGNAAGGIISRSGKVTRFASGGAIMRNGRASWWNSVNKYAAGTTRAHGTVFVAGENGPEIMGHVNGRTEILNKSQLADAMYGAVVAGMANAVNSLGSYLANRMATCTNAIVSTISANSDISALAGMNYYAPAMATGGIMPYDVAMQISRSAQDIQNTLNANNEDLIQAMVSAMGNAANSIVQILQRQMMQNNVSSRGNRSTDAIDAINRQSLMYGKSPLKGV